MEKEKAERPDRELQAQLDHLDGEIGVAVEVIAVFRRYGVTDPFTRIWKVIGLLMDEDVAAAAREQASPAAPTPVPGASG